MKKYKLILVSLIMLMALLMMAACGDDSAPVNAGDDPIVIEPGINGDDDDPTADDGLDTEDNPGDTDTPYAFTDKGEQTTVDDLVKAQSHILSYYFEQTIPYPDGSVFMRVWYYQGQMKVITSIDGYIILEDYYDYNEQTHISYSPGDDSATQYSFDPYSDVAPVNPKQDDYSNCTYLQNETIGRQLCFVLQTNIGDKLWVSTKYGFPLQVEFADSFGAVYTVEYRNVEINTIAADDVAVPAGLTIK